MNFGTCVAAVDVGDRERYRDRFEQRDCQERRDRLGDDAVAPGGWVRRRARRSRLPVAGAQAPAIAWPLLSDTGSCTVAYGSPSAGALALRERM
jgi:hypothetical protein